MQTAPEHAAKPAPQPDSRQAWWRLLATLLLMTIGSAGMYVVSVMLPVVQADFGISRAEASLPYTLLMVGFGLGCVLMGKLADRYGIVPVIVLGACSLGVGFVACGWVGSITSYAIVQGLLVGLLGSSATFVPLVADTSLWFNKRRGIAVAVCASGNYLAGAIWPPVVQHFVASVGWRPTYVGLGIFTFVSMLLLALAMRARTPVLQVALLKPGGPVPSNRPFGLSLGTAQALLCVAGTACCVAMAMPQVHIVAYCGDLGFGAARGAEMLSLMLASGIVSRLVSGAICDSSAVCAPCCWAAFCRVWRSCCSSHSTAWPRCTWSQPCSACSRAASCPATPSSCESTSHPPRPGPVSAP